MLFVLYIYIYNAYGAYYQLVQSFIIFSFTSQNYYSTSVEYKKLPPALHGMCILRSYYVLEQLVCILSYFYYQLVVLVEYAYESYESYAQIVWIVDLLSSSYAYYVATLEQYQLQYGYILRGCHQEILLIWSSFEFLRLPVMDFDFSFLLASTVRAIFRILRKRRGGAEPNREDSSSLLLIFQLKF